MKLKSLFFCAIILLPCLAYSQKFLVFGANGWIGQKLVALLKEQNHEVYAAQSRLENRTAIIEEIIVCQPDFVINAAGVTGRPNVDWCEDHRQETIRANIIGALNLADICFMHDIHCTHFGTGCIYEYDKEHAIASNRGFKEEDIPNFSGSFYSRSKSMLDALLQSYPNVLNLRLRMPISDDLNPRNFITKISRYKKVINVPNSMSILSDLLPVSIAMTVKRITGTYNFVNPGTLSHNEILELYKQYVDPTFTYENFTIEEQNQVLKSKRSNNELDTAKLLSVFPDIPHIEQSIIQVFEKIRDMQRSKQ